MPWIHATVSGSRGPAGDLARELAEAVAGAAGLEPDDVIALVTVADAAAGSGAVVTVAGRHRGEAVEDAVAEAVRRVVAAATGAEADLVAVVRS